MTPAVVLAAVSLTAGLVCLLRFLFPAKPPLHALIGPTETATWTQGGERGRLDELELRLGVTAARVLADLGFGVSTRRLADLAVMERTQEEQLGAKVALAVLGPALLLVPRLVLWSAGAAPGPGTVPVAALAAIGGYLLPDLHLFLAARRRRSELAAVVGFVARHSRIVVASGKGIEYALAAASRFGDRWAHIRLRRALSELPGRSVRQGLTELGVSLDSEAAESLANSVATAQRQGTPMLGALASIARTIRVDRLRESEAKQARRTVLMSVPVGLMVLGYMGMFLVALVAQVIAVFRV